MNFGLGPVTHATKRLAFKSLLAHAQDADFTFVREALAVSDSDLSRQAAALADADYIVISKTDRGRGAITSYRITKSGRVAYQKHTTAIEALLSGNGLGIDSE